MSDSPKEISIPLQALLDLKKQGEEMRLYLEKTLNSLEKSLNYLHGKEYQITNAGLLNAVILSIIVKQQLLLISYLLNKESINN